MIELRIAAQDERSVGCSIDVGQGAADARPGFLFLDVDGVLHHYEAATRPEWFEPRCLRQLQRIVRATGYKIVLSSTCLFHTRLLDTSSRHEVSVATAPASRNQHLVQHSKVLKIEKP